MSWSGLLNAEVYDRFVREHGLYRLLNAELVERCDLARARRVLDLACGTGATIEACLARLPADSEVVGLDSSPGMIEVAQKNVHDPRARFVEGAADRAADLLDGPFDRVTCNAAFWQFADQEAVLAAVASLTVEGALHVFNAPAERVVGERSPLHAFQVALTRVVRSATGSSLPQATQLLDPQRLGAAAAEHGLAVEAVSRVTHRIRQGELVELMRVPALIGPLTEGLTEDERDALVREAGEAVDGEEIVELPWIYFRLRRLGERG